MSMYDDDYNIVKATADAINNAGLNAGQKNKYFSKNNKQNKTKKLLNEDTDGNIMLINDNFEQIENLIENTKGLLENAEIDSITIENIYFIQDLVKYALLQMQDKIKNIDNEQ